MVWFITITIFLLGVCVGSFLNVLIDRLPFGKNPLSGRSKCDHCHKTLAPWDLVPLLSYLLLQGKCRYCKKKLSFQYPLIELFTGLMFVSIYWYTLPIKFVKYPFVRQLADQGELLSIISLLSLLVIFSSFLVIFVTDLKNQIIPDELLVTLLMGSLLYHFVSETLKPTNLLVGGITMFLFLMIYLLTHRRGIGFGDVKLVFVLGFFLGFPKIIIGLYAAFLTGALVSSILILSKKKKWGQKIAFGPFLIFGSIVSFFWGEMLLKQYLLMIGY